MNKKLLLNQMLWAKVNPFVSLYDHLLCSGLVAQHLLKYSCFSPICLCLQDKMELSEKDILSFVGYLVAMHDIGKIHPAFVGKDEIYKTKMTENGIKYDEIFFEHFRHELYGAKVARKIWKEKYLFGKLSRYFVEIIRQHHQGKSKKLVDIPIDNVWIQLQKEYEERLYNFFSPCNVTKVKHIDGVCNSLLGILIVSDWITSSGILDKVKVDTVDNVKRDEIRIILDKFLEVNQMQAIHLFESVCSFSELWDFIPKESMRPLQKAVEKFVEDGKIPSLTIIEAPMGEGKTEAALYLATHLMKCFHKQGFYVALPTAATSNQMYQRVNAMLCKAGGDKARLLHATAWAVENDLSANIFGNGEEQERWSDPIRLGMLTPFSVGTIDQAMLSALQVKYGVLRLVGLQQKVLIIDEMHAYDAYMSTIILTLLRWCKDLDIPVIILSATLPSGTTCKIIGCYIDGDTVIEKSYPKLTYVYKNGIVEQVSVPGSYRNRIASIDLKPYMFNRNALCNEVNQVVNTTGGCVCVLRNTVREARETYRLLKEIVDENTKVILFHSNFLIKHRNRIEKQCLELFGKDSSKRPKKCILVATQVVEQSLDVDFDYLFTDLCPIDLLLQRVGRERRHDNLPRPMNGLPEIVVLVPTVGQYNYSGYREHEMYDKELLDRTWDILKNKQEISLPSDIMPFVETVYREDAVTNSAWEMKAKNAMKSQLAGQQVLPDPREDTFCYYQSDTSVIDSDDEENKMSAKTRLGEDNIKIAMLTKSLYDKALQNSKNKDVLSEVLLCSIGISVRKLPFLIDKYDDIGILNASFGNGKLRYTLLLSCDEEDKDEIKTFDFRNGYRIIADPEIGVEVIAN